VLPQQVDALTPEFFSSVLACEVERVELLDHHSGTTGRARFALRGDRNVPPTVFVKLPPFDERQRAFVASVGMGVAEARFYRDLADEVPVRVPRPYFAETDGNEYLMVLEDLEATGCRFPAPTDDDVADRARDIVEQLAALHSQYWESPRFSDDGDLSWLAGRATGDGGGGTTFVRMAVDALGDRMDPSFHRIAEMYLARAPEIAKLWGAGPRTLVHGDPHMGNLFVDVLHDDRTGFLDWAVLGRSPGMRDVAYVLSNSVPASVRAAHEREWITRYSEMVGLAFDDAWQQYRLFALYSWVAAASTAGMGSKWQPLHIGLGGTKRATDACATLQTVELVEELLGP
jgi:aminoglycoside phosphotransferase (APT) family kinase protein